MDNRTSRTLLLTIVGICTLIGCGLCGYSVILSNKSAKNSEIASAGQKANREGMTLAERTALEDKVDDARREAGQQLRLSVKMINAGFGVFVLGAMGGTTVWALGRKSNSAKAETDRKPLETRASAPAPPTQTSASEPKYFLYIEDAVQGPFTTALPVCFVGAGYWWWRLGMLWTPDELPGIQFQFRLWVALLTFAASALILLRRRSASA